MDLTGTVEIVKVGDRAGDDVVKAATSIVTSAGGTVVTRSGKARIVVGTNDGNASRYRPASLSVPSRSEGYALATSSASVPSVIALGNDASGAFHAMTTLRQITVGGKVTGATITDWPTMQVRGVVEGFYGVPWSHRARLDTLSYMGSQHMNTYVYAPKDDPYLRARWRDLYPSAELGRMKELAGASRDSHVNLVVAISPYEGDGKNGNTPICYSSQQDYDALVAVLEQLRGIGITNFYVAFDDIVGGDGQPAEFDCASDTARFTGADRLVKQAHAQAYLLNRLQREYITPKGLPGLWTVPTQYTGTEATAYKTTLGQELDDAVTVQWTGAGVVSESITTAQAAQAAGVYGTSNLVIWDNFPTNDGENAGRLFLSAMPARSSDLGTTTRGITTNPMIQPYASRIALAEYASYSWNPGRYDAQVVRDREIARIAGADSGTRWQTMQAFVDTQAQWEYTSWRASSTWNDVYRFIWAFDDEDQARVDQTAATLRARLKLLSTAPTTLSTVKERGFYDDTKPWIDATANWADADLAAVDLLLALRKGDTTAAENAHATMESKVALAQTKRVDRLENGTVVDNAVVAQPGETSFSELVDKARQAWSNR